MPLITTTAPGRTILPADLPSLGTVYQLPRDSSPTNSALNLLKSHYGVSTEKLVEENGDSFLATGSKAREVKNNMNQEWPNNDVPDRLMQSGRSNFANWLRTQASRFSRSSS